MKRRLMMIVIVALLLPQIHAGAQSEDHADSAGGMVEPNYMQQMMTAATTGDQTSGERAQRERDGKIDRLGLPELKISFSDLNMLAKIIYAEAGSSWLCDEWKMSVGEVVLNRVASPEFPDTIPEVIYQRGQYYGAGSEYFASLRPSMRCVELALRLLEGERVLNDTAVVFQANFRQGSGTHTAYYDRYLGATYFCYSMRPELYAQECGHDEG